MKKSLFKEIYPVCSITMSKEELKYTTIAQMVEDLKIKIKNHPIAKFVAIFDNHAHTSELGGEIMDGLLGATNLIFCFGPAIPNTKIMAVRPRGIGICEFEDKFEFEFLEAPIPELTNLMTSWIKDLAK